MKKPIRQENLAKIDMVAEQWVRLVLDHIQWMRVNKDGDNKNDNEDLVEVFNKKK